MAERSDSDLLALLAQQNVRQTNIRDVVLEDVPKEGAATLGYTLQQLSNLSNREYNFDPVQSIFMDKLVSEDALRHPIKMLKEDYFKGMIFMDYAAGIIFGNYNLSDEIMKLVRELQAVHSDPSLADITKYAGVQFLQTHLRDSGRLEGAMELRYTYTNERANISYPMLRDTDPVYLSLGRLVMEQLTSESVRAQMPSIQDRNGIKASIVVDAALDIVTREDFRVRILETYASGNLCKAAYTAMTAASVQYANSVGGQ